MPHITLKQPFTPKIEVKVIVEKLQSVAATTRPFTIVLDGFEYFEGEQSLAFIAVKNRRPVSDLHSQIVYSLHGLTEGGDEHEFYRFVPHVTIHDDIPKERLSSFKAELAACGFHMEADLDSFVLFANDGTGWKHTNLFRLTGR